MWVDNNSAFLIQSREKIHSVVKRHVVTTDICHQTEISGSVCAAL